VVLLRSSAEDARPQSALLAVGKLDPDAPHARSNVNTMYVPQDVQPLCRPGRAL